MNNSLDAFLPHEITNIDDPSLLPNLKEINETAETKAKSLEILRKELTNSRDIEPCLEENFLLRFLRVSKFNPEQAFQRVLKFYQQQEILLDAFKKLSIPLQKARNVNHIWLSPYRLKNNSTLVITLAGKIDHTKVSFAESFYLTILAVNEELENPVSQITGVTLIFDFEGFNARSFLAYTPSWVLLCVKTLTIVFPARIKALHIVNAPSLFLTAFKIIYLFLPKKLQDRMFMHPNDGWKSLHAAIPPEVLLAQHGGDLKIESCINILKNIEELEEHFHKLFKYGYIRTQSSRQSFRPISRKN